MSTGGKVLSWMDDDDDDDDGRPTSQARAMTSTSTSSMGGAPPLHVNGRGYTVFHVHNESSSSGPAVWAGLHLCGLYCTPCAQ